MNNRDHDHGECSSCGCGHNHSAGGPEQEATSPGGAACGCGYDLSSGSIRPILVKTIIAGFFLGIAMITEGGFLSPPELGTGAAIVALLLTAYPILKEAVSGLMGGERNVCELASIAIVAAAAIGEFTAAAEVAIILTIGEVVEAYGYSRSKRDINSIITKNPRSGYIMKEGTIIGVPVQDIAIGDTVMVRPGDMVPVDGIVIEGGTCLDESCLTGESLPVTKEKGSLVSSGSINLDETLIIRATRLSGDSTYSRIVELIRQAGLRRPPSLPVIDRFARAYSPLMLVIAGLVLLGTGSVLRAITVLIVACPCALLLATPSAVLASIGSAAKKGILLKGGEFLEICQSLTVIVMDKTGTLTSGKMHVADIIPLSGYDRRTILTHAASAECSLSHPVARAITAAATDEGIRAACGGNTRNYSGLGVEDHQNGHVIHVGSLRFMKEQGIIVPDEPGFSDSYRDARGQVLVAVDRIPAGIIYITDTIRPESPSVIRRLKGMGINHIGMLTGDNQDAALSIGDACGFSRDEVHAGMYPKDKEQYIAGLQEKGHVVCFVGDGTNDGPALARADLAVSIGSREDTIALETSGVILMKGGLSLLPDFIMTGRRTRQIIVINIVLALGLNAVLLVLAAAGVISPALGAIGHQAATLLVLFNSARLAYAPYREKGDLDNGSVYPGNTQAGSTG